MKSIIQNEQECYFCHRVQPLHEHHIVNGTAGRKQSERYGLKVWLCAEHHDEVHRNQVLDEYLKRIAQETFEHKFDHTMWMRTFRKNYL